MFEDRASDLGETVGVDGPPWGRWEQLKLLDGSMQAKADKLISRIGKIIDWPSFHEPL